MHEEKKHQKNQSNEVGPSYMCGTTRECCYYNSKCSVIVTPDGRQSCGIC